MRRPTVGALTLAVVAALTCTGCIRTGEDAARHEARVRALEDAERVAEEIERRQFRQGGAIPASPATVQVAITRRAETGGGLFYATGSATVCVRFELHGTGGPRRVTTREIDCPPLASAPPTRT